VLEGALAGKRYLLGNAFTIADQNVASVLWISTICGVDLSGFSNVQRWMGDCTSRPAFRRAQGGR
jgi:glutathione S-transferase